MCRVELGVVGHVQQLDDQVTGQQLRHKWMLKKQVTNSVTLLPVMQTGAQKSVSRKTLCVFQQLTDEVKVPE